MFLFALVPSVRGDEDREGLLKWPNGNFVIPIRPAASNADPANPDGRSDVITERNNNLRTGATVENGVGQQWVSDGRFGLQEAIRVIGAVLAQPLYMERVNIAGVGIRPTVFIATASNWLYAVDAEPPFPVRWSRHLGDPLKIADPWTTKNLADCSTQMILTEHDGALPPDRQSVVMGIEATPAIEPRLGRIYVSYRRANGQDPASGTQRLAALDIRSGAIVNDRAVEQDVLWNALARSRASLLVDNGLVFIGYAPRCEGAANKPFDHSYHGWVYAFDENSLAFRGRYETTKSSDPAVARDHGDDPTAGGGIWQASSGIAADGNGNIFFATGNADTEGGPKIVAPPDATGNNLSNSIVRLKVDYSLSSSPIAKMTPIDWFTPYRKVWQDHIDLDFGSAGVVLIPNTHYLVGGGKEGIVYVLDRYNLGRFDDVGGRFDAGTVAGKTLADPISRDDPSRDRVIQKLYAGVDQYCGLFKIKLFCFADTPKGQPKQPEAAVGGVSMDDWIAFPHIHGTPVFGAFAGDRAFLYLWPEKDHLKSYAWRGASLDPKPTIASALPDQRLAVLAPPYYQDSYGSIGMPGGMLSLSIDLSRSASGVLFASIQRCRGNDGTGFIECSLSRCRNIDHCRQQKFGMLRAFDPITLKELWNNQVDRFSDAAKKNYWFSKFVPPTIAKGRVFLATASDEVLVYGRH